jgi:hypothetical protein
VGLFGEALFVQASGWAPINPALVPKSMILGLITAVAAAIIGARLARSFTEQSEGTKIPLAATAAATVALVAVMLYPLPRNVGDVDVVIRTERVGNMANVEVQLDPPDAAENAVGFGLTAWQGGGFDFVALNEVGPGRYVSEDPVPVTGKWKSMVNLLRGDEVMAAPIYLPADPEIGAPEIPVVPERRTSFVKNTDILLREVHDGPAWPSVVAFSALALILIGWISLIRLADKRIVEDQTGSGSFPRQPRFAMGFGMLPKG